MRKITSRDHESRVGVVSFDDVYCSTIAIRANVVRSSDKKSVAAGSLASILLPPPQVVTTRARVQAPTSVGSCDGIVVFGTSSEGHAGRALSYAWDLTSVVGATDPNVVSTVVASFGAVVRNRPRLEVPAAILPGGIDYVFSLTVSNWLGSSNTQSVTVRSVFALTLYKAIHCLMYICLI